LFIFLVAALYASVGHGGASGYLALMALYEFAPEEMKPTALILNLFVAGISFFQYFRKGYFKINLWLPFIITSIPAAFAGGTIQLDPILYKRVLGVLLLFAIARMLGLFGKQTEHKLNWPLALLLGGIIGFFSGLIGIGGGIILSPVILLLGWGSVKETAAVSSLFIWVNSLAGLLGFYTVGMNVALDIYGFILVAIAGGLIGGYVGSFKWNEKVLRYALSFVLLLASVKLMLY